MPVTDRNGADQRELAGVILKRGYSGIKKIGEGSFGVALLCEDQEKAKLVCKVVDISRAGQRETAEARREGRLLSQLKHPYIVRYRENFSERGWLCIVMDFCDGGDLTNQIEAAKKGKMQIDEKDVMRWATQGVLALKYIHGKHVLHRDLKPQNFFLTKAKDLRMGDFGMSKVLECTGAYAKTFVGTPYYLSPETMAEKPYAWPADIWSMGCILYHLCALKVPFEATSLSQLASRIASSKIPTVPQKYSESLRTLTSDMMKRSASQRPSADDIINRPVVQEVVRSLLSEARKTQPQSAAAEDASGAKPTMKHEVMDQFQMFDRNGDGVIDRGELGQVLKHLDAKTWTDKRIDQILRVADKNKDGKIQLDEFLQWVFGGEGADGLTERAYKVVLRVHAAVSAEDFGALTEALLELRQAVDLGLLRVSPKEVAQKTCVTVDYVAARGEGVLNGGQGTLAARYENVRHLRAIMQHVEQLLDECGRPRVCRIASIGSRVALRGLCFELADGLRCGESPNGLDDAGLDASNAAWTVLADGERVLEVKGFGTSSSSRGSKPSTAGDAKQRRKNSDASPPRSAPAPGNAGAEDGIASWVVLRTNQGREIEFGNKLQNGAPFSFKAPDGEEIVGLQFAGGTCRGIETARIMVNWSQSGSREVEKAFRSGVGTVWPLLHRMACQMGPRYSAYALLEARRLGLPLTAPKAEGAEKAATVEAPAHWDLSLMREGASSERVLGPDARVVQVPLQDPELRCLQALLAKTYRTAAGRGGAENQLAPLRPELVKGVRLQHWRSWALFAARQEAIRKEMQALSEGSEKIAELVDPAIPQQMDALNIPLDSETNCAWLFHGISGKAVQSVAHPDFDIDRAGGEEGRLYGRGVYFAEVCSKVDRLAPEATAGGFYCMLLCRVTMGHVLRDDAILPDTSNVIDACTGGPYHSVLGDRSERCPGAARDFVVFDKDQVYPEFLLWYRRKYS